MALAVEKNSADRRTPYSSSRQTFATAGPHAFLRPKAREEEPSAKNDKWHCQRTEGLLPSDVIPIMLFSERQMSDYKSAALMDDAFPTAKALLAYHDYDADWFRAVLEERGITAYIPSKTNRKVPIPNDAALYR